MSSDSTFKSEFLKHYLEHGLGSLSKSDIDALVMHLLDRFGRENDVPLKDSSNQDTSIKLRTPVSKIKKLRYDAALKYGGEIEATAKKELGIALTRLIAEADDGRISVIVESVLARNWLQGKLKEKQVYFDFTFNSEVIRVKSSRLMDVLEEVLDKEHLEELKKKVWDEKLKKFKDAAIGTVLDVVKGAAKSYLKLRFNLEI